MRIHQKETTGRLKTPVPAEVRLEHPPKVTMTGLGVEVRKNRDHVENIFVRQLLGVRQCYLEQIVYRKVTSAP